MFNMLRIRFLFSIVRFLLEKSIALFPQFKWPSNKNVVWIIYGGTNISVLSLHVYSMMRNLYLCRFCRK